VRSGVKKNDAVASLGSVRLAVVGTGLIGASVGLAAKRAGVRSVTGFDSDPSALAVAAERGAIDAPAETLADAVAAADLVVVATPVSAIPALVAEAITSTGKGCIVTDVGSTKARICSALEAESRFVGGHPLAGSEAQGPRSARADMFDGSTWFLASLPETDPERYGLVHRFVGSLGANVVAIDPVAHDQLVGLTSHLPHALANLLVNQVGGASVAGHDSLAAAGASFRDMTRVAGSNSRAWVDILLDNREIVGGALAEHRSRVEDLEALLRRGDAEGLTRWIDEAARNRQRLTGRDTGDLGGTTG
jgi:prephenate dehydrogenase